MVRIVNFYTSSKDKETSSKFRKPKNSADLAEIKTSLQAISLQLQQIENMLNESKSLTERTCLGAAILQ